MSRTKYICIIAALIVAIAFVVSGIAAYYSTMSVVDTQRVENVTAAPMYVVKNCGGRVGVYKYGQNEPMTVWDIPVSDLPEYDRAALVDGYYVYSDRELAAMREDLGG